MCENHAHHSFLPDYSHWGHSFGNLNDVDDDDDDDGRIYMDYNATTPMDPEVIDAVTTAMRQAWGNPSSNNMPAVKARDIINLARESVSRMVGGKPEDIIFTSGGTEANNLMMHTAVKHYWKSRESVENEGLNSAPHNDTTTLPHIVISNVEHDSIRLPALNLQLEGKAEVTYVAVSKATGRAEPEDVVAAIRPNTCLVSIMTANNETGIVMPIKEICQRVRAATKQRTHPRILLHTDAAQAIGKISVDARDMGVDYLTIVGHKFYGPRAGALYVNGPGTTTPLYPMLFGGGQERNFRPGTENTAMIAGLGKAAELVNTHLPEYESHLSDIRGYLEERLVAVFGEDKLRFNGHFPGSERIPNTCNVSILGSGIVGRRVLATCRRLLASVGAACHSGQVDRPSCILLSCGVPV
ncbi:selenocysteine lyase isoform X2 [Engraulis encrasicolus]